MLLLRGRCCIALQVSSGAVSLGSDRCCIARQVLYCATGVALLDANVLLRDRCCIARPMQYCSTGAVLLAGRCVARQVVYCWQVVYCSTRVAEGLGSVSGFTRQVVYCSTGVVLLDSRLDCSTAGVVLLDSRCSIARQQVLYCSARGGVMLGYANVVMLSSGALNMI